MNRNALFSRRQGLALVLACIGWGALGLQGLLFFREGAAIGQAPIETVLRFFSFFTILTNIIVAAVLSGQAAGERGPAWLRNPGLMAGSVVWIIAVGLVYTLVLRHNWNPQGWLKVADILLHDVMPTLYPLYWLGTAARIRLPWRLAFIWLAWPAAYALWALARGAASGFYPYPFLDIPVIGYALALRNAVILLLLFLLLGVGVVSLSRLLANRLPR